MSSMRKLTSNRLNALKSTGPRTANGKNRTKFNALSSGIYALTHMLPGENPETYNALRCSIFDLFKPQDVMEEFYVDQILFDMWILQRIERGEKTYLTSAVQWHANRREEPPQEREQRQAGEQRARETYWNQDILNSLQKLEGEARLRKNVATQEDVDAALVQVITNPRKVETSEKIDRRRRSLVRTISQNIAFLTTLQERHAILITASNESSDTRSPANDSGQLGTRSVT